jgi:hypothetical protein
MRSGPVARFPRHRRLAGTLNLALPALFAFSVNAVAAAGGGATTTITGSFADSCRDVHVQSGKDISHVEIHYVDGRIAKDETIDSRVFSIDGGSGDEIDFVIVKSGTTKETLGCQAANSPPTATLEVETPPLAGCLYFPWPEYPTCLADDPRTTWSTQPGGTMAFLFLAPYPELSRTFSFRASSSTDPDNDIVSWSIDFGDGTSASGPWDTAPSTDVVHVYSASSLFNGPFSVTLTVTDAEGESDSETTAIVSIDATPD